MGWYNVVDLAGQCKGQIKVGVIPLSPISSHKTTSQDTKGYAGDRFSEKTASYISAHFTQRDLNNKVNLQNDKSATNSFSYVGKQDTSKSFLLRQLRQNMKELDIVKERLRQRLVNSDDGLHTEFSAAGELGIKAGRNNNHKTKTDEVLEDGLMKEESTSYSRDDPSPPMQDIQFSISEPLISCLDEQNMERQHFYKDDGNDLKNNNDVHHRNDYINNDDVSNVNNPTSGNCISTNDDDHFVDDVSVDCDNNHPFIDGNTSENDDGCDHHKVNDDRNSNDDDKPVECDQAMHNNSKIDVVEVSGDESQDSFFDILKRNTEVAEDVKLHCEKTNDELDPQLVVSRKNLEKLKNVLNEANKDVDLEIKMDKASQYVDDRCNNGVSLQSTCVMHERGHSVRESEKYIFGLHQNTAESGDVVETTNENEADEKYPSVNETSQQQNNHFNVSLLNKASFPNFFMPPKDLEQSMRSIRLAATFRKEPRKNIHEQQRNESCEGVENDVTLIGKGIAKSFANWKQVEEIRTTGNAPITSKETSRLAKIFSSTYSAAEEK